MLRRMDIEDYHKSVMETPFSRLHVAGCDRTSVMSSGEDVAACVDGAGDSTPQRGVSPDEV